MVFDAVNRYKKHFVYIGFFFVLLVLFWEMPRFSDDYEFADLARTKAFPEVVDYILYYGNGRLLGNIFAICLVNLDAVLATVIKTTTVWGIVVLLPHVLGFRTLKEILLSFLLILGIAPQIYAQVFIWTSGFSNYTLSVFFSLVGIFLVQKGIDRKTKCLLLGSIGFLGQLFVEHGTILNLLVSTGLIVWYHLHEQKQKRDAALVWFAGCVLGAIAMFLLPVLFYVEGNRSEGYRDIHFDNMMGMLEFAAGQLFFMIVSFSRCTALFAVFSCFGWSMHQKRTGAYHCFAKIVYLLFPITSFLFNINENIWISPFARYIAVYAGLLIYCAMLVIDVISLKNTSTRDDFLILILLAVISAAPFLVITPFGERCLFLSYIFLALFALKAAHYADEQMRNSDLGSKFVISILVIFLAVFLCVEMVNIRKWDSERNMYIEACIENNQNPIEIFEVPSPYYAFQYYLLERYYYYESWGDISYEVLPYDEWVEQISP